MFHPGLFLNLGFIQIPFPSVVLMCSLLVWYVVLRYQDTRGLVANDKWRFSDHFLSLALTAFFLFKFWPLLSHPSLVLTHGSGILFMSGGRYVQLALLLLIFGWLGWLAKRHQIPLPWSGRLLLRGLLPALALWHLLLREYGTNTVFSTGYEYQGQIYHPVNLYLFIFTIGMMITFWGLQKRVSFPLEPWMLFFLSALYILLNPLRVNQQVFLIFQGAFWPWFGFALGAAWIVFTHTGMERKRNRREERT